MSFERQIPLHAYPCPPPHCSSSCTYRLDHRRERLCSLFVLEMLMSLEEWVLGTSPWTNRNRCWGEAMFTHSLALISCIEKKLLNIFLKWFIKETKLKIKLKISSSHLHIFLTIIDLSQWTFSLLECAVQKQKMLHRKWTPGAMKFMVTLIHLLLTQLVEDFYLV
jgi:hypothetical protein